MLSAIIGSTCCCLDDSKDPPRCWENCCVDGVETISVNVTFDGTVSYSYNEETNELSNPEAACGSVDDEKAGTCTRCANGNLEINKTRKGTANGNVGITLEPNLVTGSCVSVGTTQFGLDVQYNEDNESYSKQYGQQFGQCCDTPGCPANCKPCESGCSSGTQSSSFSGSGVASSDLPLAGIAVGLVTPGRLLNDGDNPNPDSFGDPPWTGCIKDNPDVCRLVVWAEVIRSENTGGSFETYSSVAFDGGCIVDNGDCPCEPTDGDGSCTDTRASCSCSGDFGAGAKIGSVAVFEVSSGLAEGSPCTGNLLGYKVFTTGMGIGEPWDDPPGGASWVQVRPYDPCTDNEAWRMNYNYTDPPPDPFDPCSSSNPGQNSYTADGEFYVDCSANWTIVIN